MNLKEIDAWAKNAAEKANVTYCEVSSRKKLLNGDIVVTLKETKTVTPEQWASGEHHD